MIWLALFALLCCSAVISGSETALFGLDRRTLHQYGRASGGRRLAHRLMQQPAQVLMTVLIANTAINVAIFSLSFLAAESMAARSRSLAAALSVGVLVAVIALGEILPKTLALSAAGSAAPFAAMLVAPLSVALSPLRWILRTFLVVPLVRLFMPTRAKGRSVTTEELQQLVEQSACDGVIDSREQDMLQAIVAAGEVSVREVMTPRVDIVSIHASDNRDTVAELVRQRAFRKVVVRGDNLDDIRGVLYARDLYTYPDRTVSSMVRPVHTVPEQARLVHLMRYFRLESIDLAIVVDEYGGTAGLVSIDDVVDWTVGDQPDTDESGFPTTELVDENTYRIAGNLSIRLWAEKFGLTEIERGVDTVSGLILAKLGRVPRIGDSIRVRNITLTVEKMQRRRVVRILLRRNGTTQANQVP